MNEPKKPDAVPAEAGPVVSQATDQPADAAAAAVPTPADAPLPLSQVPAKGWSGVNLPPRS